MTPGEPVKVLHILGALTGGGIQTFLLHMLRCIDRERFSMDVCTMSEDPGELAAEAESHGARVFACPLARNPLQFGRRFPRILREGGYHVVHVHRSSSIQAVPLRIARRCGVSVRIAHYQNVRRAAGLTPRGMAEPFLRQAVLRHATHVVGVSASVLASHFGRGWRVEPRFRLIPNCTDTARFIEARKDRESIRRELGFDASSFVVGHAGRFSPAKNHGALIDVARRVYAEVAEARFLLVGDGPLRPEIEQRIRKEGLQEGFLLTGWRSDMPRLLAAMDVFFFPSLWEGLPLAVIEAMAAGLPCITSDLPCLEELLPPELWELRVPAEDPAAAAECLMNLAGDAQRRKLLGQTALEHASRFDARIVARRLEELYLSAPEG